MRPARLLPYSLNLLPSRGPYRKTMMPDCGGSSPYSKFHASLAAAVHMQDILVIDDEPNILESFRISFTEPKFHLQTAGTAGDGLQLFAEQRFDVVVADIGLPDMSGLEMYQRIQAIDSRVPVIFITGNPDNKHVIEAMRLGAYDVLFKPLNPCDARPGR